VRGAPRGLMHSSSLFRQLVSNDERNLRRPFSNVASFHCWGIRLRRIEEYFDGTAEGMLHYQDYNYGVYAAKLQKKGRFGGFKCKKR